MNKLSAAALAATLAGAVWAAPSVSAQEKADPFADLFGAPEPKKKDALKELEAATKSVKGTSAQTGLKVKQTEAADLTALEFSPVLVAELVRMDSKAGCQVWGKTATGEDKTPIDVVKVKRLPGKSPTFFTCITAKTKLSTQTQVKLLVQGPRKERIGQATVTLQLAKTSPMQALMEWPRLELPRAGRYTLVYEVAGKTVAKQKLFDVVELPAEE